MYTEREKSGSDNRDKNQNCNSKMGFWLCVFFLLLIYLVIVLILKVLEEKRVKNAREEILGKVSVWSLTLSFSLHRSISNSLIFQRVKLVNFSFIVVSFGIVIVLHS